MFDETLKMRLEEARAQRTELCLVLCDIDHFKRFNDTWGHHTGDQILRLCEDTTGLLIGPSDRRLPPAGAYVSQLRGEFHHRRACRDGAFSLGAAVHLVREPNNEFDRNAVAVYDVTGAHLTAYVNKRKARMLAKLLDRGEDVVADSRTPAEPVGAHAAITAAELAMIQNVNRR